MRGSGAPRSLRIALLNPCYWPEVRRGSERFLRDLADGLLERGHRPSLITSHPEGGGRTVEDGLEVIRVRRPPDGRLRRRGFEDHLTHVPLSYLALLRGEYDLAHALFHSDAAAAIRWSRRRRRPVVYSHMGVPDRADLVRRRRRLRLVEAATRGADATVALSAAAAAGFERTLALTPRVINPGVDLATFVPAVARATQPTILCAADPSSPRKRVRLLIGAVTRLNAAGRDVRLVLSRPRDVRLATELAAIADWIELRDLDDRGLLAASCGEAWVSALPSLGEAFGLVLVEALACGTPVVAADDGGMIEIVDDPRVGRLVALGSVLEGEEQEAALAEALAEALALADEPSTAELCRRSAERFSVGGTVERYERLYRELLLARSG